MDAAVDLTPRIGSEVRADRATLMSGSQVQEIRRLLEERGVIAFREINLSDEEQLVIYRVTQESLSNVAQHAEARHVLVELSFVGRTVLRIADDGCGVQGERNGGLGLTGMHERARLYGGRVDAAPEGGGFVVRASLPLEADRG